MSKIVTVRLDLAKNLFLIDGADGAGRAVLRKNLRRSQVLEFQSQLPSGVVAWQPVAALIFCWREISKLGHDVRLIAPVQKARDFATWLSLVPRKHSTGGKQRLGTTTKMGERSLRQLLIIGEQRHHRTSCLCYCPTRHLHVIEAVE